VAGVVPTRAWDESNDVGGAGGVVEGIPSVSNREERI